MGKFICEWCDSTNPKYIHNNQYTDGQMRIEVACADCWGDKRFGGYLIQKKIRSSNLIKTYYEALNYKNSSADDE